MKACQSTNSKVETLVWFEGKESCSSKSVDFTKAGDDVIQRYTEAETLGLVEADLYTKPLGQAAILRLVDPTARVSFSKSKELSNCFKTELKRLKERY